MRYIYKAFIIYSFIVGNMVVGETLRLKVNQLRSLKGNLIIYLWSNPDTYLMKNQADYSMIIDLEKPENVQTNGNVLVKIEDLSQRAYAVMLYHDENRSYNFERNFVGIPLEGFAFGNNAKPNLGAPKFQESSINLREGEVVQQINILY